MIPGPICSSPCQFCCLAIIYRLAQLSRKCTTCRTRFSSLSFFGRQSIAMRANWMRNHTGVWRPAGWYVLSDLCQLSALLNHLQQFCGTKYLQNLIWRAWNSMSHTSFFNPGFCRNNSWTNPQTWIWPVGCGSAAQEQRNHQTEIRESLSLPPDWPQLLPGRCWCRTFAFWWS